MAAPLPRVDIGAVRARVDPGSFSRGERYAGQGAVADLTWSPDRGVLTSLVLGNSPAPYRCRVDLERVDDEWSPVFMACSCPVGSECKHAVATVLTCHRRALEQREDPEPPARRGGGSDWRSRLEGTTPPRASGRARTPLALGFSLGPVRPFGSAGHAGPNGRTVVSVGPAERVAAGESLAVRMRPLMRGRSGSWIKGNLAWRTLTHQIHRLSLEEHQLRWFNELLGLYDATRTSYAGVDADGLPLADFRSPLLWTLLRRAEGLGIDLVGADRRLSVELAGEARVEVTVCSAPGGGLRLQPTVGIDDEDLAGQQCLAIGDHGIAAYRPAGDAVHLSLAPTTAPFTGDQRRLVADGELMIPAGDVAEFYDGYFPLLSSTVPVRAGDDAVHLPEIAPASLRLTATFRARNRLSLSWQWEYHDPPRMLPFDPRPDDDHRRLDEGHRRDEDREAELIETVEEAWPGGTRRSAHDLQDTDTAEFATKVLPVLQRAPGLDVRIEGRQPDYEELTGTPQITVTTVETERTDWFDLGFIITIDGRQIPFTRLFEALSRGRKQLMLVDRSYFSLEHPALDQLRDLLAEAQELQEWEPDHPRISRYQVDLWADFVDLADETIEARAWRESVSGLRDLTTIEPVELPEGVRATLRPYQLEGFRWLVFLWRHRLGGILADDMGLGKTLQTLGLIAHAREHSEPGASPFLVIAPTSVVDTWLSEAARFTPRLRVRAITGTRRTRGTTVAHEAEGVDVVVTSYAIARLDAAEFSERDWGGLVLDEAQFVKNPATRVHREIAALRAPFRLAITGTPLENSLTDLWALASLAAPGLFPSARRFREEYVRPIESGEDPGRLSRLRRRLRPFLLRRTKEAVAAGLPAKQEQVMTVDLSTRHRQLYDTVLQRERQKVLGLLDDLDRSRFIVFRSLTLLRMLALAPQLISDDHAGVGSSKLDALLTQLTDVAAEGHRALVFSQFTSFLKLAAARCEGLGIDYVYLDGSTRDRPRVIEAFRAGSAPVFFISLRAGGFGLTLTEADYVFMLDPWWNPAIEAQAVDRTHRIGQTKNVMVYRLVARETIEEKVMDLQRRKAELFTAVMDDDAHFSRALSVEDVRGLFE